MNYCVDWSPLAGAEEGGAVARGSQRVKGVNVGNCAILENSNNFIEFVCSDIELNCFKYGHMKS